MSSDLHLRPIHEHDRAAVLAMNEADVHHLSPLDDRRLADLVGWAAHAAVVVAGDTPEQPLGFVVTVAPGSIYDSPNYRWFADHLDAFLYLDRIVVSADARRRGIGTFVYDQMEAAAWTDQGGPLVCEVDVEPANDPSLGFHRARGFTELGRQRANDKTVALLRSPAPSPSRAATPAHGSPDGR